MRLPSLVSFYQRAGLTFQRFPVALLFSMILACTSIYMIHIEADPIKGNAPWFKLMMSSYLGMLLFIALPPFLQRVHLKNEIKWLVQFLAVGFIVLYFILLPDNFMLATQLRFALFALALHLMVAFLPYLQTSEENGFWQYNKALFLRFLLSGLYAVVLFGGLALAIAAVDQLFVVHFNGKIYGYLWICIAILFNTWFFLAGFPDDLAALEQNNDYPKGLKLFTQYVLLPLITVYLLILYAYMAKIIFNWQWPDGWVSYLVLFFSVAGLLSLLLIHPVRNDESNKWIPAFSRFFYFAVFPLIVLLFFAIKRRIADYGITEPRYFVLLLALWLLFISCYFLISKSKKIKLIPVSLCIIALLSSFGPWGAFAVSENSQKNHLKELLKKNNMFEDGILVKPITKLSIDDQAEITSVVEYLVEAHSFSSLQEYFKQDLSKEFQLNSATSKIDTYSQTARLLELMGLEYVSAWQTKEANQFFYRFSSNSCIDTKGYDLFLPGVYLTNDASTSSYIHQNNTIHIRSNISLGSIMIVTANDSLQLIYKPMLSKLQGIPTTKNDSLSPQQLTIEGQCKTFSAKVICNELNGYRVDDTIPVLNSMNAFVLIKFNPVP